MNVAEDRKLDMAENFCRMFCRDREGKKMLLNAWRPFN